MTKITHSPAELDLSVVIPTYNQVHFTAQMFASLARTMDGLRYEIIVVDNRSTDATLSFVGSHTPGQLRSKAQGQTPPRSVRLIHNETPRLLSKSWNDGIDAAKGRHILISNNDVLFAPGAIRRLVETADREAQAGIVVAMGPQDVRTAKPLITVPLTTADMAANLLSVEEWGQAWAKDIPAQSTGYVNDPYLPQGGYCFLLTRRAWEKVGRFSESYELTGEDWQYFSRLRRHYKLVRANAAYVEHFEHQTCKELGEEYHDRLMHGRFLLSEDQEGCQHFFTVIMPVYNRVDSLKAAIDSVLAQTFPHWRLIVVDDGSQDWDQIDKMARQHYSHCANRIWFRHKAKNEGPGAARNFGLARARGKYVAFLDSDDLWMPDHLQKHFEAHESANYAMVYSDPSFAWRSWDSDMRRFCYRADTHPFIHYFGDFDPQRLIKECYIQTSGVSVWGDLARSLRFPTRETIASDCEEDWEFFRAVADVSGEGRPVKHLAVNTCRYHHADSAHEQDHLIKRMTGAVHPPAAEVDTLIDSERGGHLCVVIPTKNRPLDLRRAVQSVGASVPVIVVDDGGDAAASLDMLTRSNERGESKATLLRASASHGASWARNRGIETAESDWVQFLDDDDLLIQGWEAVLLPYLTESVSGVISSAFVPNEHGGGMRIDDELYTSHLCVRRTAVMDAGMFTEDLSWAEERELVERMERMGMTLVRTGKPLVYRPQRGGSGNPATAEKRSAVVASRGWQIGGHGL